MIFETDGQGFIWKYLLCGRKYTAYPVSLKIENWVDRALYGVELDYAYG